MLWDSGKSLRPYSSVPVTHRAQPGFTWGPELHPEVSQPLGILAAPKSQPGSGTAQEHGARHEALGEAVELSSFLPADDLRRNIPEVTAPRGNIPGLRNHRPRARPGSQPDAEPSAGGPGAKHPFSTSPVSPSFFPPFSFLKMARLFAPLPGSGFLRQGEWRHIWEVTQRLQ